MNNKLYEQGLEEYPVKTVITANIAMLSLIFLGTILSAFYKLKAGVIFVIFAVIMVYVVLRIIICHNCYYHGRLCPHGWGKIAAIFTKKGYTSRFGSSKALILAPLTYGILIFAPIIMVSVSMVTNFTFQKALLLTVFIFLGLLSTLILRKKSCALCKMKYICPGSAAPKEDNE